MSANKHPLFNEVQYMRQWWLWLIVVVSVLPVWLIFIQEVIRDKPLEQEPAPAWLMWLLLLVVGVGLPWLLLLMRLTTTVYDDHVIVRFFPVSNRHIPIRDIDSAEARQYNPIREYGGWGIRYKWFKWANDRAYNMSGNQGVQLVLRDDKRILIGSQRADELAAAIHRAMNA